MARRPQEEVEFGGCLKSAAGRRLGGTAGGGALGVWVAAAAILHERAGNERR